MAWAGKKVNTAPVCAECQDYFNNHTDFQTKQCLRKLSKKVDEGLVAIPYPYPLEKPVT